jgi:mannose/cellobiose epimerase-like protein (N-acyl-D-glucosamine 2-epimerase family)
MNPVDMNLVSWMREIALPFWAARGADSHNGGFVEELQSNGSPSDPGFKRVRVQGRQLFSFATAALLEWHPDAAAISKRGFDFIQRRCRNSEGAWAQRLKTDGSILDGEMDLYDTAFIVLGLSTYYQLTRDPDALRLLGSTLDQVKTTLSVPGGRGYFQSTRDRDLLRQNPHMHWFEAMLYAFEATGDDRFLREAGQIYQLAQDHLIDPKTGALRELFDKNWNPVKEGGRILVEPGHHYEWAWLLWKAGQRMAVEPRLGESLLGFADRHGVDTATGLVYDQVSDQGELTQPTHRLWVQTEFLKAWLVRGGQEESRRVEQIRRIETNLLQYYLNREPLGTWGDRLDSNGMLQKGPVPASSMYHIMVAVTELSAWRSAKK